MAHRIAHLISARHVGARDILGLSFTNKAAKELKERVTGLVKKNSGPKAAHGLTISTFHSLCARVLRVEAERIGYRKDFTIVDEGDQRDTLRGVLKNINIDERKFDLDVLRFAIGQAKNKFMGPGQADATYFMEASNLSMDYAIAAESAYGRYQDQLKVLNAFDFDDLLFQTVRMLESSDEARLAYNRRFRYILVDEYQDTNPAQFRLLHALTEQQQNITVVGDDDQSIYGWRGADAKHILEFGNHFPGARVITLDQNYRSTTTILKAANEVIAENRERHPKRLWSDRGEGEVITEIVLEDDRQEADFVAEEIGRQAKENTRPWKDFAVLYRSNAQSRVFEEALRRNGVPYKMVGGMSFLDRKEVKDTLSYLRVIVNHSDDASLRRILNWPARGIGKSSVEALSTVAFEEKKPLYELLPRAAQLAPRSAAGTQALHSLITGLRNDLERTAVDAVEIAAWGRRLLERVGVKRALEEEEDDVKAQVRRWESVEEVIHSLGQFKPEVGLSEETVTPLVWVREFLARMALEAKGEEEDRKDKDKDADSNQVTLLTLHGSKGLEYPVVFLVGVEDGFLPHKRTLDGQEDLSEERRLCYVGITRAKDHLILTRAKNRIRYGKPVPRYRCRFLKAIPQELILTRDESKTPDLSSEEAVAKHEAKVVDFLSQIRASLGAK